jgi:hypothetical protein
VASENLSHNANQINMKKLQVNAQVTATTAFIETFTQAIFVVVLVYNKGTTYSSLILVMLLYQIILPYAFLMNTSHNKNRIVEFGWKIVLYNLIGRSNNSVEPTEVTPKEKNESQASTKEKIKKSSKRENDTNTFISIISSPALQSNFSEDCLVSQSTSSGKKSVPRNHGVNKDVHAALGVNAIVEQDNNYNKAQKIISMMIKCINNEILYIEYFKKLVDIQDSLNKGIVHSDVELDDVLLPNCAATDHSTRRPSKGIGKGPRSSRAQFLLQKDDINIYNEQQLERNINNGLKDRVALRTEVMNKITTTSFQDDTHSNLIEELIDLEEEFVKECYTTCDPLVMIF